MINFKKIFKKAFFIILILFFIVFVYLFIGVAPKQKNIEWGVNFSQQHSRAMGLNWQENYLALMDDLNVKSIKIAAHWDAIEPEPGEYFFEDLDWQIKEAQKRGVKILLVIGMKTPRWPECHIPQWAKNFNRQETEERILIMLQTVVSRYKDYDNIYAWQVENEPFFYFGECPWLHGVRLLREEVTKVKSTDSLRPVIISDTGEWSLWLRASTLGDVVGITMYKKVWITEISRYATYPFPPVYYWRRAYLVDKLFGKEVINIELQAEPWGPRLLYDISLEEQAKTMNVEQFRVNIELAKNSGLSKFYLWGSEWWYWMKEKHNRPEMWEEAKGLFVE